MSEGSGDGGVQIDVSVRLTSSAGHVGAVANAAASNAGAVAASGAAAAPPPSGNAVATTATAETIATRTETFMTGSPQPRG